MALFWEKWHLAALCMEEELKPFSHDKAQQNFTEGANWSADSPTWFDGVDFGSHLTTVKQSEREEGTM